MECTTILETRRQIQHEKIDEEKSEEVIAKPRDQPRFERRCTRKYHRSQRWTHDRLPVNLHR